MKFFLSPFTFAASKRLRGHFATAIVAAILGLSITICAWMAFHNIKPKFAFMIDAVEVGGADSLTIGSGSDVCFKGAPADYLVVHANKDGSMDWRKNPIYKDSLEYIKINNYNPNRHEVRNDASQQIVFNLPYGKGDDGRDSIWKVTLTGADIWKAWNDWGGQQNILARHLAAEMRLKGKVSDEEARKLRLQLDNRDVKSFFNATYSSFPKHLTSIRLVILDNFTTIDSLGYKAAGNTFTDNSPKAPNAEIPAEFQNCCKVQFVNISSSCYRTPKDDGYFQIDGVNYVMKTPPMLSEWGAGHVMLRHTQKGMCATFPKAIGYVGSVDSLRDVAKKSSGLVTLRQNGTNFPTAGDLYLPQFSGAFGQDICNLHFNDGSNTVVISDANNNKSSIAPRTFSFLPTLQKIQLRSGSNTIDCRAGIIDGAFFMSYLWLPLCATLIFLFIILGPVSPFRIKTYGSGVYSNKQLRQLPTYLACLFSIAMGYCVCKSLIAIKLSYSFPYFEKITAITPVSTTLMLIVAFTCVMIFNHAVMTYRAPQQDASRKRRKIESRGRAWLAWGLVAALFAATVYTFFFILDPATSGAVKDSYFSHEWDITSKWWSESAYGVLDNHRTIPYALIFVETLLLVVSALSIIFSRQLLKLWKKLEAFVAFYNRWVDKFNALIGLPKLSAAYDRAAKRHGKSGIWKWTIGSAFCQAIGVMVRTLWPGHIVLIVAMAFIGPALGNFGTALITLCVIVGLCRALTSVRIANPQRPQDGGCSAVTAFLAMVAIAFAYMLGAMVADNGYMTNLVGFIMAVFCFFNIIDRPGYESNEVKKAHRHERLWISFITFAATAFVVAMPFICSHFLSSTEPNYSRSIRRVMLYSDFGNLQRSGYRYAESDAEFMVIMSHYMQTQSDGDALNNDTHQLHPSVSTGQSPVVLNDLSAPAAFFGAYGARPATAVYFLMLLALLILVIHFSVNYDPEPGQPRLTRAMQWRILAVFMWVGTSYYIYFSYIDWLPFTGRLNPGFGVDAVGEALESAVLLAFMGAVTLYKPEEFKITNPAERATVEEEEKDNELVTPDIDLSDPEEEETPDVDLSDPEEEETPDVDLSDPEEEEKPDVDLSDPEEEEEIIADIVLPDPEPAKPAKPSKAAKPATKAKPNKPNKPARTEEHTKPADISLPAPDDEEDVIFGVLVEDDEP